MAKLVDINKYRNKQQRSWLRVHEAKLNSLIAFHIQNSLGMALDEIAHAYSTQQVVNSEESWEYWDLRDLISEVFYRTGIIEKIYEDLNKEVWFKQKFMPQDKLLDLCVSRYILNRN